MLLLLVIFIKTLLPFNLADTSAYDLIVGSYTKEGNPGIEVFSSSKGGENVQPRYTLNSSNASYLAITADQKLMYAVKEVGEGKASTIAFQASSNGNFHELNSVPNPGNGPCFIAYREETATVYTANYESGSLTVYKTEAGKLLPAVQHIVYKGSGVKNTKQDVSRIHYIAFSTDRKYLYVVDMGADRIHQHKINTDGTLDEQYKSIPVKAGSSPRHLVFNKSGSHAYLINKLSGTVDVFKVSDGNLSLQQSVKADTSSAASKLSADIHISPDGNWLLTSNRVSSNELTVFAIQKDGLLLKKFHQPVGKHPRNFSFDPSGEFVYVGSMDENRIQVFSFNRQDGTMKDLQRDISIKMPAFILFKPSINDSTPEDRLKKLNIELIKPTAPIANYVKAVQVGNLIYLSGHGPDKPEGGQVTGKVGKDLTIEEGQAAARLTGISLISTLKAYVVDLSRVNRIVKVLGLVNCEATFTQQPAVINGFSNLMVDVFGEKGKHARSAVGAVALPNNIAVEIEMIVELKQ